MKKLWIWFIRHKIYFDIIGFVGLGVMGYGFYSVAPWLAFVVVGLFILVIAVAGARNSK